LVIGATEFRDVAFVVVPDDHLFADWSIGEQGVIGIPILWMLRTIRWNSNGEFETGFPSERQDLRKANLCFDEYRLVAEVGYRDAQLIFSVDTGADTTILYVRFRDEFPALAASGQKQTRQGRGISGVVNNDEVIALSPQNFRIGTFPLALADPAVYLNPGIGVGHHGNLGWRQLSQARTVTFDFSAMTLTLEGSH